MKKKKYFLSSIFLGAFALSTSIITACSVSKTTENNQEPSPQPSPQIEVTKVARNVQPNYEDQTRKNGLFVDAEEKANEKYNVLMYSINWVAVLHKFGSFYTFLKFWK